MERNDLSNSGRGPPKEQSDQLWLKSTQVVTEELSFELHSIFSSGGHLVDLSNFGRGSPKEQSYHV